MMTTVEERSDVADTTKDKSGDLRVHGWWMVDSGRSRVTRRKLDRRHVMLVAKGVAHYIH